MGAVSSLQADERLLVEAELDLAHPRVNLPGEAEKLVA
jgi:hypothetical protein